MGSLPPVPASPALSPVYAFNAPGEPVLLYQGLIGGPDSPEQEAEVQLSWSPRTEIRWRQAPGDEQDLTVTDRVLLLRRPDGEAEVPAHLSGLGEGWVNSVRLGSNDAQADRIVAHWFNLPALHGTDHLEKHLPNGETHWWAGRWMFQAEGWKAVIDRRFDYTEACSESDGRDTNVMTHVMELTRDDGARFTVAQAEPVLQALQFGVSFALGRWAAPMLPVALAGDRVVWEHWSALLCDPLPGVESGWWWPWDRTSLNDVLQRYMREYTDPDRARALGMLTAMAVIANKPRGFIEPRITQAVVLLERFSWEHCREHEGLSRKAAKDLHLDGRLRKHLDAAGIEAGVDPKTLPAVSKYLDEIGTSSETSGRDGATAVARVRNALVHPEARGVDVYDVPDLLTEIWHLATYYVNLLMLHRLGFQGKLRDLHPYGGLASDTVLVPWAPRT